MTPATDTHNAPTDDLALDAAPRAWYGAEHADELELDRIAEQAEAWLEALLSATVRTSDPRKRSLTLTAVDRLLAAKNGYLQRLREIRTAAIRDRLDAGESTSEIARHLGLSRVRVRQIRDHNRTYVSEERRAELDEIAARRARRAADARRARELREAAERAARNAERAAKGAPWLARLDADPTVAVKDLAAEAGVSRQMMTSWLSAARDERAVRAAREVSAPAPAPAPVVAVEPEPASAPERIQDESFASVEAAFEAMTVGTRWRRHYEDNPHRTWVGTVVKAQGSGRRWIEWDDAPAHHFPTRIHANSGAWWVNDGLLTNGTDYAVLELLPASASGSAAA